MIKNKEMYLTSAEAAKVLNFSEDHIRKLIAQGKMKAEKFGRNWVIDIRDLKDVKRQRFPRVKDAYKNAVNK
jgi:excisionase family DNA binding protein